MGHFFDLPRELRDQIYLEALASSNRQIWACSEQEANRLRWQPARCFITRYRNGECYAGRLFASTALFQVNRQIYYEARDVLVKANHVLFRPPRPWPDLQRLQNHIAAALNGSSNLVRSFDTLKTARSLTLDPASITQLEVMARIIKLRTVPLVELVVAVRRICYDWDPRDFPKTEQDIEGMFVCLAGVKAHRVRIEWPKYPFVHGWETPQIYHGYGSSHGAGWPIPVTDKVAAKIMGIDYATYDNTNPR